jgi:hypothetical protein
MLRRSYPIPCKIGYLLRRNSHNGYFYLYKALAPTAHSVIIVPLKRCGYTVASKGNGYAAFTFVFKLLGMPFFNIQSILYA